MLEFHQLDRARDAGRALPVLMKPEDQRGEGALTVRITINDGAQPDDEARNRRQQPGTPDRRWRALEVKIASSRRAQAGAMTSMPLRRAACWSLSC